MKNTAIIAVIMLGMTGCATTSSGPIELREGVYMMSKKEGAFPLGLEPLLEETIEEAKSFCASKGKTASIVDVKENEGPFIFGNYPKATITFECID